MEGRPSSSKPFSTLLNFKFRQDPCGGRARLSSAPTPSLVMYQKYSTLQGHCYKMRHGSLVVLYPHHGLLVHSKLGGLPNDRKPRHPFHNHKGTGRESRQVEDQIRCQVRWSHLQVLRGNSAAFTGLLLVTHCFRMVPNLDTRTTRLSMIACKNFPRTIRTTTT